MKLLILSSLLFASLNNNASANPRVVELFGAPNILPYILEDNSQRLMDLEIQLTKLRKRVGKLEENKNEQNNSWVCTIKSSFSSYVKGGSTKAEASEKVFNECSTKEDFLSDCSEISCEK